MKKLIFSITLFSSLFVNAQILDVSINPVGTVLGSPDLQFEYIVTESFGASLTLSSEFGKPSVLSNQSPDYSDENMKNSGFGYMVAGKYYFSPDDACDGMFLGLYLKGKNTTYDYKDPNSTEGDSEFLPFKSSRTALGLLLGSKMVTSSNIVIEYGFGGGRMLKEENVLLEELPAGEEHEIRVDTLEGFDIIGFLSVGYRF